MKLILKVHMVGLSKVVNTAEIDLEDIMDIIVVGAGNDDYKITLQELRRKGYVI